MLSRCEEVWVVSIGDKCRLGLKRGDKCYISDGMEYEPTNLQLWDSHKDKPEWAELAEFARSVGGEVVTNLVHEESILAIDN